MIQYLQYALLIAFSGTGIIFLLQGPHMRSREEESLREAAQYTIIDMTPDELERGKE